MRNEISGMRGKTTGKAEKPVRKAGPRTLPPVLSHVFDGSVKGFALEYPVQISGKVQAVALPQAA